MEIGVGKSFAALIDAGDYPVVAEYKWSTHRSRNTVYARRRWHDVDGTMHYQFMHVLIMGNTGVDHVDHNGLNNTRSNLRLATVEQNSWNRRTQAHSSVYKGVFWDAAKHKWRSCITIGGRAVHLGRFADEDTAARAYDAAAKAAFGKFAGVNFP
jgi:hypothetical protein